MRTELHFHLLPGVDDGPRNDREAIALAQLAVLDGTRRVVATPHAGYLDIAELPERVQALRAVLAQAGVDLKVHGGAELSPRDVPSLSCAQLEAVAHGPTGARWLLLEAPLVPSEPDLAPAAAELHDRGFGLLIAHPERSPRTSMAEIREQVRLGAVLQINASSLTGGHGVEARRAALDLVGSGLPYVLASDAHSPDRPPLLTEGAATLDRAGVSAGAIRDAIETGPERLLIEGLPQRPVVFRKAV
jgi:protein-tyrosine phosphatase